MVIKFICPNGHELSAPENRAGKPGKCPQCGTQFLIPDDDDDDLTEGESSGASWAETKIGTSPKKEETIVFLCPNGHRLNGPAYLQGKPGQCPHCGEKFHIPDYEEDSPEVDADLSDDAVPVGMAVAEDDILEVVEIDEISEEVEIIDEVAEESKESGITQAVVANTAIAKSSPIADGPHTMADLFMKLWQQKKKKDDVELHLSDGKILVPKFFFQELSNQECGVFAEDKKGKSTDLHIIPWQAMVRVRFANVTGLSKEK